MKFVRLLFAAATALVAISTATGVELTAEQRARLNALPPHLREQALQELRKMEASNTTSSQPLEQHQVVTPRVFPQEISEGTYEYYVDESGRRQASQRQQSDDYSRSVDYPRDPEAWGDGGPQQGQRQGAQQSNRFPWETSQRDSRQRQWEQEASQRSSLRQDGRSTRVQLKRFGYELFAGTPSTFAPATEIPVPTDYIIGPNDQIRVQYFGKESGSYDLRVSRDGVLQIPNLGPMTVAGQSFTELKSEIARRASEQMIGVQAFVSMGELRSIRVFVLGDVSRPGSYTVSALSTLTNALFVSGGISPIGSLRNIQLKRAGETVAELDLYDLLLRGDTSSDARLQPGDVIFVPPAGSLVGVAGEVKRPAIYELKHEQSVGEAIAIAGGFSARAYPQLSQIERIAEDGLKEIVDINLSNTDNRAAAIKNGDLIRIYSTLDRADNVVRLEGMVERPGNYQWFEGMRIRDLIPTYGELVPTADLRYSLVVSTDPASGKIFTRSFSLEDALSSPTSFDNLPLNARDRVLVFNSQNEEREGLEPIIARLQRQATSDEPEKVAQIGGHVRHPGRYPLDVDMTASDLIRAAGGFSQDAYTLEMELIRFVDNDKTQRESVLIPLDFASAQGREIALRPFDQIHVKRVPEWNQIESVTLRGEVRFPGTYTIERGETLSQIIQRAGGLSELAHPSSAVFLRESLRRSEQEQLEKLRRRLRDDISATSIQTNELAEGSVRTAEQLLSELEASEAVGRLVIDLPAILAGSNEADVLLRGGDELVIPQRPQSVTIIGSVNYPTSHLYEPGLSRDDYIALSGGALKRADKRQIYVVRSNGKVVADSRSRFFPKSSLEIFPGDTIVVPLDVDRMRPLEYWGEVSQIIYQMALGVAAVNSL